MELSLVHSNKINKRMIKIFNTPYIKGIASSFLKEFFMGVL